MQMKPVILAIVLLMAIFYDSRPANGQITHIGVTDAVEVYQPGDCSVEGRVTSNGQALWGAKVTVILTRQRDEMGYAKSFEIKPDSTGAFKVENLKSQPIHVFVDQTIPISENEVRHITRYTKEVGMRPIGTTTVNFGDDLTTLTLMGRALVNQVPLAFKMIRIQPEDQPEWAYTEFGVLTNGDGNYRLTGLRPGKYTAHYNHVEANDFNMRVEFELSDSVQKDLEFNFGQITVPHDTPPWMQAANGRITNIRLATDGLRTREEIIAYRMSSQKREYDTSARGVMHPGSVDFPGNLKGKYVVVVKFALGDSLFYNLDLPEQRYFDSSAPEPDPQPISVPEFPVGSLHLTLLNAQGDPLAGQEINLRLSESGPLSLTSILKTDEQGRVEFPAILEGDYTLHVGRSETYDIHVEGDVTRTVTAAP